LDFGESIYYSEPVWNDIKVRFPINVELTVLALLMSFAVAIPLGVVSALNQDRPIDYASRVITIIGIALPNFWVAIILLYILSVYFDWLPPLAYVDFQDGPWENLQQMFFPALALAASHTAFVARITRSATLEVFREDYIRTARSKGLAETVVVTRHALKNAMLPVITVLAYEFGRLMGGTVVIETVFGIPGLGSLLITSITNRDYPAIQGIVVVITVLVLVLNVVTDLVYAWLNPRIRYA
jgi:peptide/nickel transport system permease protein